MPVARQFDPDWYDEPPTPPALTVDLAEPVVIGTILGPDGAPLVDVLDRPRFPFGFCRPE